MGEGGTPFVNPPIIEESPQLLLKNMFNVLPMYSSCLQNLSFTNSYPSASPSSLPPPLRFWYENPGTFEPDQLTQIKQFSLARVICDNSDNINRIPEEIFHRSDFPIGFRQCKDLPSVDLRMWAECPEGKIISCISKAFLQIPFIPSSLQRFDHCIVSSGV